MSTITCVRTKHDPTQTYEDFKAMRLLGFGASDMGSLLNEGDYSCKRRLFLERLGLFPGDDARLQHHVERGKFLEGPVAELYAKRTGRVVKLCGTAYVKEFPYMRANADRLIHNFGEPEKIGCLEIKCPAEWMFKKIKKDGLPLAYILQLQWQMLCYGVSLGSFAIYWADGHELEWFDVERDDALIEGMIETTRTEWMNLEHLKDCLTKGYTLEDLKQMMPLFPAALDPHAKACARCPMYETCHNAVYEPGKTVQRDELAPEAHTYVEVTAQLKELEKKREKLKELFTESFRASECDTIRAVNYELHRSERSRENLSAKAKEVLTAKQRELYISQTTFDVITVKPRKDT